MANLYISTHAKEKTGNKCLYIAVYASCALVSVAYICYFSLKGEKAGKCELTWMCAALVRGMAGEDKCI